MSCGRQVDVDVIVSVGGFGVNDYGRVNVNEFYAGRALGLLICDLPATSRRRSCPPRERERLGSARRPRC